MAKPLLNYASEWFKAVPARWYGMIGVLSALVVTIVFAAVWLNSKGLEWWWILLGIGVAIAFVIFSFLAFLKVASERDKIVEECKELAKERDDLSNRLQQASHGYIADSYIQGRIVHLLDLLAPGAKPIILNRTIEDSEIRGPAMVILMRTTIADSMWDGDLESLFVEIADERMVFGAIGLQDCVFRRCRFIAIGILGTKEQIEKAKLGFIGSIPRKEGSQT